MATGICHTHTIWFRRCEGGQHWASSSESRMKILHLVKHDCALLQLSRGHAKSHNNIRYEADLKQRRCGARRTRVSTNAITPCRPSWQGFLSRRTTGPSKS
jgi:hypothetical protein